jgi:ATP-dependent protease ClpP protease subunit
MSKYCDEETERIEPKNSLIEQMKVNAFLDENTVYLWSDIDDELAFITIRMMEQIESRELSSNNKNKKITIKINSPGGDIFSAFSIISKMGELQKKGYIIETIAYGLAMSAALAILQCGTVEHRKSQKYTCFTLHQISAFGAGFSTVEETDRTLAEKKRLWDILRKITKDHSKVDDKLLNDITTHNKDYYFDAEKALELGFIDSIL